MFITETNDADVDGDLSRSSSRSSLVDMSTQNGYIDVQEEAAVNEEILVPDRVVKNSLEDIDFTFYEGEHDRRQNEDGVLQR